MDYWWEWQVSTQRSLIRLLERMDRKNLTLALIASALITILVIPTIANLPLPASIAGLGTIGVAIVLGILSFIGYLTAEFLSKWVGLFKQLGRFAIVGVLN